MREVVFRGDGFDLPLLTSDVLPASFRHGFTTRQGGVSVAQFSGLNLGKRWGDDPRNVLENQRRLRAAAGCDEIHFATQVHGREVARVAAGAAIEATARTNADALATEAPRTCVGVYVADCVPIVIADVATGACAAVHAGWRGTVAGVLAATLADLATTWGTRPADVRMAIGPSIGPCCFEVGPEVVAAVETAFPDARAAGAIVAREPRAHVDLWRLNQRAALAFGVPETQIEVAGLCTSCDRDRFFSFRRDRGQTGQMAAFIVREPSP